MKTLTQKTTQKTTQTTKVVLVKTPQTSQTLQVALTVEQNFQLPEMLELLIFFWLVAVVQVGGHLRVHRKAVAVAVAAECLSQELMHQ
jgi:hypothetical protein